MDIWDILYDGMPSDPKENCDFWGDAEQIFCRTEEQANILADMLNKLIPGRKVAVGHYDDSNDFRDKFSGWYYVTI